MLPAKKTNLKKIRKGELCRQNDKPKQKIPASFRNRLVQPLPIKKTKDHTS